MKHFSQEEKEKQRTESHKSRVEREFCLYNLENREEKENCFKNLTNREEKENFCLKILKIEKRKRNENTILQLEREKYESFLLEIETLVNDCKSSYFLNAPIILFLICWW